MPTCWASIDSESSLGDGSDLTTRTRCGSTPEIALSSGDRIGLASLRRLEDTNERRRVFLRNLFERLKDRDSVCYPGQFHDGFAPFCYPIFVDPTRISASAERFALAVQAEGVPLGAKYGCVVNTWPWTENLVTDSFVPENAVSTRDRSFNLHLHENYGDHEVHDIIAAIDKVAEHYSR